jgi:hypothetical protein
MRHQCRGVSAESAGSQVRCETWGFSTSAGNQKAESQGGGGNISPTSPLKCLRLAGGGLLEVPRSERHIKKFRWIAVAI